MPGNTGVSDPSADVSTPAVVSPCVHVVVVRGLTEIKITSELTEDEVVSKWGKPQGHRGSGISYLAYTLDDGREVWLAFLAEPPRRLRGAVLFSQSTGRKVTLF
jgi:hypothetical protein